jgi:hypothetical protein
MSAARGSAVLQLADVRGLNEDTFMTAFGIHRPRRSIPNNGTLAQTRLTSMHTTANMAPM